MLLLKINNDLIFSGEKTENVERTEATADVGRDSPAKLSAAFVRRQAAHTAVHLGVAAGFLHGAALLFGTRLVAVALIDLTLLIGLARVGLARIGLTLILHRLRPVLVARRVAGIGIGKARPHQATAQQ